MREVENAEGTGSYTLEYELGESTNHTIVPAFQFLGLTEIDRYVQREFDNGKLLVAFRYGSRGICRIQFNPSLIVQKMTLHGAPLGQLNPTQIHFKNSEFQTPKFLQSGDSRNPSFLDASGATAEGKPFHAKISYKPTTS